MCFSHPLANRKCLCYLKYINIPIAFRFEGLLFCVLYGHAVMHV